MLIFIASSFYDNDLFQFNLDEDKSVVFMVISRHESNADEIIKTIVNSDDNIIVDDTKSNFSYSEMSRIKDVTISSKNKVIIITNNIYWTTREFKKINFSIPDPIVYGVFGERINREDIYGFIRSVEISEKLENILKTNRININISKQQPSPGYIPPINGFNVMYTGHGSDEILMRSAGIPDEIIMNGKYARQYPVHDGGFLDKSCPNLDIDTQYQESTLPIISTSESDKIYGGRKKVLTGRSQDSIDGNGLSEMIPPKNL